ncbi:hypothetical protein ACLKA6_010918 [Drosophila palustris]
MRGSCDIFIIVVGYALFSVLDPVLPSVSFSHVHFATLPECCDSDRPDKLGLQLSDRKAERMWQPSKPSCAAEEQRQRLVLV